MRTHRQTHRSSRNHTHIHSPPNYRNHQQQRGYNPRNAPRHPNFQPSRRHDHNVDNNPHANYWYDYSDRQFMDQYQTPVFQHLLPFNPILSSISRYSRFPYYEQIDDVYVATRPMEFNRISGETSRYLYFWIRSLIDRERNLSYEFRDHEEKEDDDEDVLKYLKIRTHQVPAKDGIDPEVVVVAVADVELNICSICQSEYEHEENIGALQCGHEYHTDCIKQWLLKKKDCPMCRASVLPSQEQRCACLM